MNNLSTTINNHFSDRAINYDDKSGWVYNKDILDTIFKFSMCSECSSPVVRIGDLGSGTCVVSDYIFSKMCFQNKMQIFAIDINEEMLLRCTNDSIIRIVSSIEHLPFLNSFFDILVTRQCFHYIKDIDRILQEANRVLKPNGTFVFAQIVPYDSYTQEYWSKIIQIRQPLRQCYFCEEEWDEHICRNGFILKEAKRLSTVSSYNDWLNKYRITDNTISDKMKDLLFSAPNDYKEIYNIHITDNDITYNSYWVIKQYYCKKSEVQ